VVFHVKTVIRQVLASTPLEYTLVCNGYFMDYFLPKGTKRSLKDFTLPVDVENANAGTFLSSSRGTPLLHLYARSLNTAALSCLFLNISTVIPGSGNERVSFTLADDIGAAIATLMDVPKWDHYTFVHGDTVTWNQVLAIGERVTGISAVFLPSFHFLLLFFSFL
jgi:hypothetical protein